jgi:hypothetical protein
MEKKFNIEVFVLLEPEEGRHYISAKHRGHFQKGLIKKYKAD